MANKKVIVEVEADADVSDVEPLEKKINELRQRKLNFEIETNTAKLDDVKARITELENKKATLDIDADDAEIKKIDDEIEALKFEEIDLNLKTAQAKVSLDEVESEMRSLEDNEIEVNLRNQSAMEALDQIGQGFDRLKQGASEVGQAMGDVLESAGRMEQTETFLSMNLGADVAKKKLEEIRSVTDKLPGDDVTLQNLLSQAALKDANMTTEAFTQMGTAAADYMAAMQNFGKSATETQQDLMNYILAGNTAEIERSPILQSHIDKLKEATTVQERSKALQEALAEEGWNGIASQDIYNNKLQQFNDMIERGKMNLGDMFLESSEGAMDFIMKLDEMSGGLVGMTIALSSFASPLTDMVMGLGQIATGLNALKDAGDLIGLTDKLGGLKNTVLGVAESVKSRAVYAFNSLAQSIRMNVLPALKSAITGIASFAKELVVTTAGAIKGAIVSLGQLAKSVLLTGYNALKSAAMWVAEKAALIASTIAEYAAAAAQWALNIAMDANPIGILILAIGALVAILGYLYFNNEQVRGAIDGLGQSFVQLGQWIYSGAIYWLEQLQNTLTGVWDFLTSIGELITGTITVALEGLGQAFMMLGQWIYSGAIYWVEQLQNTLMGLWNYIVTLGGLIPANVNITGNQIIDTVLRVILFIATLPAQLGMILTNALAKALGFKGNFVQTMFSAASNAVSNFASGISGLAGKLKAELDGMISDAMNFAGRIGSIMWEAATNAWQNFLNGLDTHSPGIMQRTLLWEVSEMGRRVPIEGASLVKNLGDLAKDAVTSFGTPEMNVEFGGVNGEFANGSIQRLADNQGTTQEINIVINGDIDNEDRLQYFVERIRSEMNWNNRTAGRSV